MRASRRAAWLGGALVLLAAVVARAQPEGDTKAAADVVMKQLAAFRRGDFDAAYAFASTEVRHVHDRQGFEAMVKQAYPEIASSTYAFVAQARRGESGHLYLYVKIGGANGNKIEALYEMVWEESRWKINGVVTKPDTSESASLWPNSRAQERPTTLPSASMSIVSAAGALGSPGIVTMSPA